MAVKISLLPEHTSAPDGADEVILDRSGTTYRTSAANFRKASEPKHFTRADVGSVTLAPTPGTFDHAAAAEFIRRGVANAETISAVHLHLELGGGASMDLAFDVFRYRPSTGAHDLVASVALSGSVGDDAIHNVVPTGVSDVEPGDYLKCQATAATPNGAAGVTIDVHFS